MRLCQAYVVSLSYKLQIICRLIGVTKRISVKSKSIERLQISKVRKGTIGKPVLKTSENYAIVSIFGQ